MMSAVHDMAAESAVRDATTAESAPEFSWDLYESREAIEQIRSEWESLLESHPNASRNAEPQRLLDTLEAIGAGGSPAVLLIRNGRTPCAVLVGRTEQSRIRCRLGYFKPRTPRLRIFKLMYGGCVGVDDDAVARTAADAIRSLIASKRFECVFTNKLDCDSAFMSLLAADDRSVQREIRPHWVTELTPHSYEQTLSGHSSKHRSNLRRLDRKLCAHFDGEVELRIVTSEADVDSYVESMRSIFEQTYKAGIAQDQMMGLDWAKALKSRAAAGELRSYLLVGGGKPIAYQTGSLHRGVYSAEGTAYLPEFSSLRPGTVLMMRVMQDLCDQGAHVIDWGFGDAEYKRLYGTRSWNEAALHVYGDSVRSRVARLMDRMSVAASVRGKKAVGSGLTSRIKRWWRDRAARKAAS